MHYALQNKYPIETEGQVKTAVEYFDKFISRFQPMDRAVIAFNIEKRAADLSVDMSKPWVTNYARMFHKSASVSPDFERNIQARKDICVQRDITINVGSGQVKAAEMLDRIVKNRSVMPGVAMVKAIEAFDKTASLAPEYDSRIVDPVLTVFGSLRNAEYDAMKVAGDLTDYDLVRASRDKSQLEKVAAKFGDEFATQFKDGPVEATQSLRSPEQASLVEILS